MIRVEVNNLQGFIDQLGDYVDTFEQGVKIGVFGDDVDEKMATYSKVLEHRWHYKGNLPRHWGPEHVGEEYVTWAYAARTKQTMEKDILPNLVDNLLKAGVTGEEFWKRVGDVGVKTMRLIMSGVMTPPNTQSTIARKGESNPLIETGDMKDAVSRSVQDADDLAMKGETSTEIPSGTQGEFVSF